MLKKNSTYTARFASFGDLHLEIMNSPFMCTNIPKTTT